MARPRRRHPSTRLTATYQELEAVATRLGISVVLDRGSFTGGTCLLEGEEIIVLNRSHPLEQRTRILAEALRVRDLSDIYLKPVVRELLEGTLELG